MQRWVAVGPASTSTALGRVTVLQVASAVPKFVLINRLFADIDIGGFDYVLVVDDDIYLPRHFLPSFLAYQEAFDFALAQPARAWHSHFDHAFALRRPWLLARRTRFVECGPLVSFRREAAAALLPFAHPQQLWGLDLVWPLAIEGRSLRMGIIDAVAVDHSLRPQAAATTSRGMTRKCTASFHAPLTYQWPRHLRSLIGIDRYHRFRRLDREALNTGPT